MQGEGECMKRRGVAPPGGAAAAGYGRRRWPPRSPHPYQNDSGCVGPVLDGVVRAVLHAAGAAAPSVPRGPQPWHTCRQREPVPVDLWHKRWDELANCSQRWQIERRHWEGEGKTELSCSRTAWGSIHDADEPGRRLDCSSCLNQHSHAIHLASLRAPV